MWVPHKKTQAKTKQKESEGTAEAWEMISEREKKKICFLFIISQIPEFLTVGFRRDKHEKCSMRRGLCVSTKNTGFHREFR